MAVLKAFAEGAKVVCIREVQNSIRESVRSLIVDKIEEMGLQDFFTVLEAEIRGRNGSLIIFKGMQSYNAANIKSLEGFHYAWVEEAQTLSEISLRMLRPTLREEGSELWFSWNPRWDTDPVDKFFRGPNPPPQAISVEVNWKDNPWFPDVLRNEMEADFAADPEMAEHVWGGGYEIVSEGAYYARLVSEAEREGRIGAYGYDPKLPVLTSWDIGIDDYTAIWFWQDPGDGETVRVIDYYEASGEGAEGIVASIMPELLPDLDEAASQMIAIGRRQPYTYGKHFLPHDVRNREWGGGGRSRVQTLTALGVKPIHRGAAQGPVERIAASRRLLPHVLFDRNDRVDLGLKRLRRYRRKWNDALNSYTTPLHDENSHGADAFGEFAMTSHLSQPKQAQRQEPKDLVFEAETAGRVVSNFSISDYVKRKERAART